MMSHAFRLRLLLLLICGAVPIVRGAGRYPSSAALAAWAERVRWDVGAINVSAGVELAIARSAELLQLAAISDYGGLLDVALSLPPHVREALPPAVADILPDVLVSATASLDVAVCMPRPPISSLSSMHVERLVRFTGMVDASGSSAAIDRLQSRGSAAAARLVWAGEPPRGLDVSHDGTPVLGVYIDASFAMPAAVHSGRHGSGSSDGAFIAAPSVSGAVLCNALPPVGESLSQGLVGHSCLVGGSIARYGAPELAAADAVAQHRRGAADRVARLRLRPELKGGELKGGSGSTRHPLVPRPGTGSDSAATASPGVGAAAASPGASLHLRRQRRRWDASAAATPAARRAAININSTEGARTVLALRIYFSDQQASAALDALNAQWILGNATTALVRMSYGTMRPTVTLHASAVRINATAASMPDYLTVMTQVCHGDTRQLCTLMRRAAHLCSANYGQRH